MRPAAARHAHHLFLVHRGARRGPAVRDRDEALVDLAPQDQVGEGKVGDDLPVGDDFGEPVGLVLGHGSVLLSDLRQGSHGTSLRGRRASRRRDTLGHSGRRRHERSPTSTASTRRLDEVVAMFGDEEFAGSAARASGAAGSDVFVDTSRTTARSPS